MAGNEQHFLVTVTGAPSDVTTDEIRRLVAAAWPQDDGVTVEDWPPVNGSWHQPYSDDPQGVTSVLTETFQDEAVVKACFTELPELAVVIFEFATSAPDAPKVAPVNFIGRADTLRKLGTVIRDTCNRAAKLAEGVR